MIRIQEVKLPLEAEEAELQARAAKVLRISKKDIQAVSIVKKSLDSRKKEELHFVYTVDVTVQGNEDTLLSKLHNPKVTKAKSLPYVLPDCKRTSTLRPVVVGFGPAGIFAALILAKAGLKPLVLERGEDVDTRQKTVDGFFKSRLLNETSNMQFGEGGAGAFSDGKLNTGTKDYRQREVLRQFVLHGAPEEILYSAKPHVGTDKLPLVVRSIREEIKALGGTVLFQTKLTDILLYNGAVQGVSYERNGKREDVETDAVILAIGHSARDTVEMLYQKGLPIEAKPFSLGARIEHLQENINKAQYGTFWNHPKLGAADYKLSCHPYGGRGAYTFCMCPGGTVVCSPSENGTIVTNGMSTYARDGENANSAVLVGIEPKDFPSEHPLSGMYYQLEIEKKAFQMGGGNYTAPATLVGDFLNETSSKGKALGTVKPSFTTGIALGNIAELLPQHVTDVMREALVKMDGMLEGFAAPDAILTAPETRSSSPVRILRNEFKQSLKANGLYPCGEGAGYAGGIVSAAVDGIKCAEMVLEDPYYDVVLEK